MKVVNKGAMTFLPVAKGKCKVCATEHAPEYPHDQTSLYYQMTFRQKKGRHPTWEDAMAHCTKDMKKMWREELRKEGIWP